MPKVTERGIALGDVDWDRRVWSRPAGSRTGVPRLCIPRIRHRVAASSWSGPPAAGHGLRERRV